jgi:hypothetical protein
LFGAGKLNRQPVNHSKTAGKAEPDWPPGQRSLFDFGVRRVAKKRGSREGHGRGQAQQPGRGAAAGRAAGCADAGGRGRGRGRAQPCAKGEVVVVDRHAGGRAAVWKTLETHGAPHEKTLKTRSLTSKEFGA